ncbi:TfoX/Sxy family protein [Tsukamurella soli]
MAYDEDLAERIRDLMAEEPGATEKRMFGGLAFLVGGHMAVAASQDGVLVRIDAEDYEWLSGEPHVGTAIMGGRTMRGWLRVAAEGVASDPALREWVGRCVDFARTLPPKQRAAGTPVGRRD